MKKGIIFAATLLLLLTMVSCNQDSLPPSDTPLAWDGETRAEKNPLDEIDFSALDTAYFVTDKDVEAYIHFKELLAKGQGKELAIQEVVPLGLNDEATLAYLLNYNEGWEIISADKRAPLVLASGEEGSFSEKDAPENVMAWIECLESDVLGLRLCKERPEWADDETWEKMLSSVDFWLAINADEEFINRNTSGTRNPKPITGYWELVFTEVLNADSVTYPHLITDTSPYSFFHQEAPYNKYCPKENSNSSNHAPAGCVAVAGGMVLGYLHNKIGYPLQGVAYAHFLGTVASPLPFYHYLTDSYDIWGNMNPDLAASLLAFVGYQTNMNYSMNGSGTNVVNLVNNVFGYFNISCSYSSFSESIVKANLQNEKPVIVAAYGDYYTDWLGRIHYTNGHSFVIDSYRIAQYTYRYVYRWVYVIGGPDPEIDDREEIEVRTPIVTDYRMRWGAMGRANDSDWFSVSGNWVVEDVNNNTLNYVYDRNMIYGFSAY